MRLHHHRQTADFPCSYLPEQTARLDEMFVTELSAAEWENLLSLGWRRFGFSVFRPVCSSCRECVSIRLNAKDFQPSTSQKRAALRCGKLVMTLTRPAVDEEHLTLYHRWHAQREEKREWSASDLSEEDYFAQFALPCESAWSLEWRDKTSGELVAVSLIDLTPKSISLIYFFYAPEISRLSPGTANIVYAVDLAKKTGRQFIYLGFRILGCASSRYKANFKPHELMSERTDDPEKTNWHQPPI
jgi:arginine-tRNA-protein transferase